MAEAFLPLSDTVVEELSIGGTGIPACGDTDIPVCVPGGTDILVCLFLAWDHVRPQERQECPSARPHITDKNVYATESGMPFRSAAHHRQECLCHQSRPPI